MTGAHLQGQAQGQPQRGQTWFRYFSGDSPEHYRWSAAFSLGLSMSHWGGSTLGEMHRAGRRLQNRVGDDEAWFVEWRALADRVRARAEEHERAGQTLTAAGAYRRACTYYQLGERFRLPKDGQALEAFRRSVECFERFSRLCRWPYIRRVEVPFVEGASLPGYLVCGEPVESTSRPGPGLVFFDGLDITKELQFNLGVEELVRRGITVLVVDGPGNGESIRWRSLFLRPDYEVAATAAYEFLARQAEVDPQRVGVMGISLGGYYACRSASREPRFKACVAWGAIWDYHATWRRRIEAAYRTSLSVPGHHIAWVLGVPTVQEALEKLQEFRLGPVVGSMRCPLLILHGEQDAQIPLEDARALYEAAGSPDKTLRVFTEEEGGAQHCQLDDVWHAVMYIADWLQAHL